MTRRSLPILLALAAVLVPVAPALGKELSIYEKMVVDIVDDQRLDACKYTTDQLKKAKAFIPLDAQQYNVAFVAAFDDAIAFRSQGGCNKSRPQAQPQSQAPAQQAAPPAGQAPPPPPPPAAATSAAPAAPAQAQEPPTPASEPAPAASISVDDSITLASRSTDVATDAPFPVLALAILAGLLALAALAFGVVRFFAWEPAWLVRFRHAAGEAGWRASSTFSEFTDFVRFGR